MIVAAYYGGIEQVKPEASSLQAAVDRAMAKVEQIIADPGDDAVYANEAAEIVMVWDHESGDMMVMYRVPVCAEPD